jgi:hypothetical protein
LHLRLVAVLLLAALPALAQPAQDPARGLVQCSTVTDPAQRLACYDALVPQARATLGPPQAQAPPAQADSFGLPATREQQTTPDQFGAERVPPAAAAPPPAPGAPARPAAPAPIDSITAGVTEFATTPLGKVVLVLDNGQVWRQLDSDSGKPQFRRAGENKVTISRGLIGSYNLTVNDGRASIKVRRIR